MRGNKPYPYEGCRCGRTAAGSSLEAVPLNPEASHARAARAQATVDEAWSYAEAVKQRIGRQLVGVERAVEELLISLMAGGHILLEDVPGVGKTALAKAFADELGLSFHRIQCTPDLLPSDILGGLVYHPKTGDFSLRKGPIFANVLLVDEINRALPRTQSALLEAMAEGQVTIDGQTHVLPKPFFVMATQNPVESQGVFPLPEAQLDRFLLKTSIGYPPPEADVKLLRIHLQSAGSDGPSPEAEADVRPVLDMRSDHGGSDGPSPQAEADTAGAGSRLPVLFAAVAQVNMSDDVCRYISRIVQATRAHPDVLVGASPRAMIMLAKAACAAAVLARRSYVTPDDVQRVAPLVLFHRLVFHGVQEPGQDQAARWTRELLDTIDVPLEGTSV